MEALPWGEYGQNWRILVLQHSQSPLLQRVTQGLDAASDALCVVDNTRACHENRCTLCHHFRGVLRPDAAIHFDLDGQARPIDERPGFTDLPHRRWNKLLPAEARVYG